MRIALIVVGILVLIILLLSWIAPSKYSVERDVVINKPKQEVFEYLKYLKNQDNWSVWAKMDPEMKYEYRGEDGTVGFVSAWEGNKDVGQGEQEITKIVEGERIEYELRFIKPWESVSPGFLSVEPISKNQTKVTWGFSGEMSIPMNIMMLFMNFDEQLGNDFSEGLSNLKKILESNDSNKN